MPLVVLSTVKHITLEGILFLKKENTVGTCIRIINEETRRLCGYPVASGGNMHAKGACPPPQKPKRKARKKRVATGIIPPRGESVAGIRKKHHGGSGGGAR